MLQLAQWIIEVYVNNFIGMAQNPSRAILWHIARDVLVSIHDVLVPPHRSLHKQGDSLGIKSHQR